MEKIIVKVATQEDKKRLESELKTAVRYYLVRHDRKCGGNESVKFFDELAGKAVKKFMQPNIKLTIATKGKQIIGFADFEINRINKTGYVYNGYVHPNYTRQGLGKMLLKKGVSIIPKEYTIMNTGTNSPEGDKMLAALGERYKTSDMFYLDRQKINQIKDLKTIRKMPLRKMRTLKSKPL